MRRTELMDCQVVPINNNDPEQGVAVQMGPRFMEEKYYQQSPAEARDTWTILSCMIPNRFQQTVLATSDLCKAFN